jgi:hypothetical protein
VIPAGVTEVRDALLRERDRLLARLLPEDPPRFVVRGGDPFKRLDLTRANRLLANGFDVADVAMIVAVCSLMREQGRSVVMAAIWQMRISRSRGALSRVQAVR